MSNLIVLFLYLVLLIVVCVLTIILLLIRKPKHYIAGVVIMAVFAIGATIADFFEDKTIIDLIEKQTTEYEGVYITSSTSNRVGATELIFENEEGKFVVYSAQLERVPTKLQRDKLYKITYFNNSKIISEWILLE